MAKASNEKWFGIEHRACGDFHRSGKPGQSAVDIEKQSKNEKTLLN